MHQPIVFINGAPSSGKDTLGNYLMKHYRGFEIAKFAWELKEKTHALYGRPEYPHDFFETCKDQPSDFFLGKTPRSAYIAVSELLLKPFHGDQIFGELLLKRMMGHLCFARGYFITDSGFESEAIPLMRHYGAGNCLLVRVRAEDRGCTFKGDSRSYLTLPCETIDVFNHDCRSDFLVRSIRKIDPILQSMIAEQWP